MTEKDEASLLSLAVDGEKVEMFYECSACNHRIMWSEKDLAKLRYCWWCGARFKDNKGEGVVELRDVQS